MFHGLAIMLQPVLYQVGKPISSLVIIHTVPIFILIEASLADLENWLHATELCYEITRCNESNIFNVQCKGSRIRIILLLCIFLHCSDLCPSSTNQLNSSC